MTTPTEREALMARIRQIVDKLRTVFDEDLCLPLQQTADMLASDAQWDKLRDPAVLHANLLHGLPAQLTKAQLLHLLGADAPDDVQPSRDKQWHDTAWQRGYQLGLKSNEQIAKQVTDALRLEQDAHQETNRMMTEALMQAEVQQVAVPQEPTYWLVESVTGPMWWDGRFLSRGIDPRHFTTDPNEAVRFARKEDAERVARQSSALLATEHIWMAAPQPPQAERVPMTEEELEDGFNSPSVDVALTDTVESVFTEGARFAERHHGIGAKP